MTMAADTLTKAAATAEQRTLDWYRSRLGVITGSRVGDLIGKGKGAEFTKTGLDYLTSVAGERLLPDGIAADDVLFELYLDEVNVTSKAMRIGQEREAEARELYCDITGRAVAESGAVSHPTIAGFASSPDGLVIDPETGAVEGTVEIKCPSPSTFMKYLSGVKTPEELKAVNAGYYWQCISHMSVTGARWCDFVVYSPYSTLPIVKVRIDADAEALATLETRVKAALDEVEKIIDRATNP